MLVQPTGMLKSLSVCVGYTKWAVLKKVLWDGGRLCKSYRPFGHALQRQAGGVVCGLRLLLGVWHMLACAQGQAGIRQVAVCVEERRVVLPVADVSEEQTNHSPNKGI